MEQWYLLCAGTGTRVCWSGAGLGPGRGGGRAIAAGLSDCALVRGHGAECDAWVCGRCRSRGARWSGGGMTRMLSVIVAATLVMLAAVRVGDAFSFSGVSVDASGIVSLF